MPLVHIFISLQNNKLAPYPLEVTGSVFQYNYELTDLNKFGDFPFVAILTLFEAQIVLSLASGGEPFCVLLTLP